MVDLSNWMEEERPPFNPSNLKGVHRTLEISELLATIRAVSELPESAEKQSLLGSLADALIYFTHPPMLASVKQSVAPASSDTQRAR